MRVPVQRSAIKGFRESEVRGGVLREGSTTGQRIARDLMRQELDQAQALHQRGRADRPDQDGRGGDPADAQRAPRWPGRVG